MSNISSVTELYNKMMQYVPIEYHYLVKEEIPLEQYEAMHKEEIEEAFRVGMVTQLIANKEYYSQKFGGKK
jgi:hypothetical protein